MVFDVVILITYENFAALFSLRMLAAIDRLEIYSRGIIIGCPWGGAKTINCANQCFLLLP